ncbi:hypothetical protein N9L68_06170 [bacterium]|nr:hypothetical protein [bacterium]
MDFRGGGAQSWKRVPNVVAPCHHDSVEDDEERADTHATLDVSQREDIAIRRRGDLPAHLDRILVGYEAMREDLVDNLESNMFEKAQACCRSSAPHAICVGCTIAASRSRGGAASSW